MRQIWVVDDDRSIRWVLEKALTRAQMPFRLFESAADVVKAFERDTPSVLLSDIRMHDMSGLDLLAFVKNKYPGLPVIIMTAFSDLDSAVSAFQGGAYEYLAKPFDINSAIDLLRRAREESAVAESTDASELDEKGEVRRTEIIGQSRAMQEVFRAIGRLSHSHVTVLLTGESVPVKKRTGDALLSGSFVVSGSCRARVDHIGSDNYVEKLSAKAKKYQKPNSQLMRSINAIIKVLAIIIFPLGIGTYFVSYADLGNVAEALTKAAGSMIGMIPSGMVLLTSVALAVSVIKLARNNALVQDLYCIEMLARVNVLCLDKTGTITDGTMSVEEVEMLADVKNFGALMANCLAATGDANQSALAMAQRFGKESTFSVNAVIPFSSARKYSAASFDGVGTIAVGAPGFVCKPTDATAVKIEKYAARGKRVMLAAVSDGYITDDRLPEMKEAAIIVVEDTVREDAVEIINWFKQNDVAVRVISGDNPLTVSVIAGKVGIENAEKYVSLEGMSDAEVIAAAGEYTVFGRVNPDQKALLIKTIKANGNTVAMTGDGVNDILAMKEADCAVAIAAGSEAARSVAHLVLMDSKFSSMPKVVREGRQVVNNIQNSSSLFLMKTTMTVFTTILMLILGQMYPFEPKNLYIIEFVVIGVPSFVLALRPNTARITGRFISNTLLKTIPSGLSLSLSVLIVYIYSTVNGIPTAGGTDVIALFVTMAAMAMTLSGAVALAVMCFPYTWITGPTAVLSAALCVLCFVIKPIAGFMDYVDVSGHVGVIVLCVAVSAVIIVAFRVVSAVIAGKKKEKISA